MQALYLLLLFPLIWPFVAQRIWNTTINYQEMALQIVLVALVTTGTWQAGKWGATQDTEVWNGRVTKKEMVDGYYQTSYSCNCTTSCSGSGSSRSCTETCQTCYTDHYTRSYDGKSTVGNWTFDSIDTEWRMRRDAFGPPASYTNCKVGEPASREHSYTNYVQAVPESLFHDTSSIAEQFTGKIPAYPKVHSFYKYNRVINVGASVPANLQTTINDQLNEALKSLGAQKQVNIIVILTDITDPNYRYAIENAWLGAEKNDVVVFLGGIDGGPNSQNFYKWVDIMTWALNSGNELFHVTLRDRLKELGTVNSPEFVPTITKTISELYDRPQMKDYEYLEEDITPATWVVVLAAIFAIGGSLILTWVFHVYDVDFFRNRGYSSRRFFNRNRNRRF